jgi:hypothetical protein
LIDLPPKSPERLAAERKFLDEAPGDRRDNMEFVNEMREMERAGEITVRILPDGELTAELTPYGKLQVQNTRSRKRRR